MAASGPAGLSRWVLWPEPGMVTTVLSRPRAANAAAWPAENRSLPAPCRIRVGQAMAWALPAKGPLPAATRPASLRRWRLA